MRITPAGRLVRGAAFSILFLLLLVALPTNERESEESLEGQTPIGGIIPPASSLEELRHRLAHAPEGSARARALRRAIDRVRRKARQQVLNDPLAENPGAFAEALALLKSTPDGQRYRPDYRLRALRAAEQVRREKGPAQMLPWRERGPGNVAGRARAVLVDAADASQNTWLVATVGGGIWKTADRGLSWMDKTPALSTLSTTCLAQCLSQPNVLYVGTGMGYGRIVDLEGSGIWKSIDGGESWQQLESTASGQLLEAINRIVVDPDDPDVLVICSNNSYTHNSAIGGDRRSGIFRSEDGGLSWIQTFDPDAVLGAGTDNRVQQIIANPRNFQTLYATVNEVGVIKSTDGGHSWFVSANDFALASDIGNPPGGAQGLAGVSVRTELAIASTDTSRLYAAVERPRGVADLYMSTDAGETWSLLPDTASDPNWFNAFGLSGASSYTAGWFDNTIAVNPYDEDVVFVGGVNLYRIDVDPLGQSRQATPIAWWIPNAQDLPVVHADHHWLEVVPRDAAQQSFWILDANDGGLGVSYDGGTNWIQQTGMGTTQFYGADKKPGEDVYIGGMQDNGTWRSGIDPGPSSNWQFSIGGDGFEVAWNAQDPRFVLGGSQFGNLSRSSDGGQTWTRIPDAKAGAAPFISKIGNGKRDPWLVFTVGADGVKRSDDFGASWQLIDVPGTWLGFRPFDNVEIAVADPQVVWISSRIAEDPITRQVGGIYVSDDGGLTFRPIHQNLPIGRVFEASGMGTDPLDVRTAYLLFAAPGRPKVLRTRDLGESWEDLSGFSQPARAMGVLSPNGFPDVAVFSLVAMPFDPDILWAGTEIGLFISEDAGATWFLANNGLPNVAIFELKIVDDQVIAATQGRGVWSVALTELAQWVWPEITLAPRVIRFAMEPTGALALEIDLRSAYDSTVVVIDGRTLPKIDANAAPITVEIPLNVEVAGTKTASVSSYRDGKAYRTAPRSTFAFPSEVLTRYVNDFEDGTINNNEFAGSGFTVRVQFSFDSYAIHSSHPYPDNTNLIFQLRRGIRVAARNAKLSYRDVCLVEEGVSGDWTHPNFFDYVVVEGSRDGVTWLPLAPGYDSTADPTWLSNWRSRTDARGNSLGQGSEALYRAHSIDLLETFEAGEVIFIRFRLYADAGVHGWGWAIDDLSIQPDALSLGDEDGDPGSDLPSRVVRLDQNVPNPFNPSTTIRYVLPDRSMVHLDIYDLAGRRVRSLVREEQEPGEHVVTWNGTDERRRSVAGGTYLYRLHTGNRVLSRKMVLVE